MTKQTREIIAALEKTDKSIYNRERYVKETDRSFWLRASEAYDDARRMIRRHIARLKGK